MCNKYLFYKRPHWLCQIVIVAWLLVAHTAISLPVPGCIHPHDGSVLHVKESYHDRCNLCTCKLGGEITCTNRTCKRRRGMVKSDR